MEDPRAEQARTLRRAGLSRSQILAIFPVSNWRLTEWLRDVPPPAWTHRPRAKDDLRERARELRQRGLVLRDIADQLGVSRSSVSLWCRDIQLSREVLADFAQRRNAGNQIRARPVSESWRRRREVARAEAAASMPMFDDHALFFAGLALFWGEGAKEKPWRASSSVTFINSDPDVIRLYVAWLALLGVTANRLTYRLSIHELADVDVAEAYWRGVVGDGAAFLKPTLKRHNPRTVRYNTGDTYHGCLVVRVLRPWALYQQIEGWLSVVRRAVAS